MRTRVNKKRMGLAIGLLAASAMWFGIAWTTWSASPGPRCARHNLSNTEIRDCVSGQASDTEPNATTFVLLLAGGTCLAASLVTGIRSLRRAMTLAEAADELGIPPGEVRRLVDQGSLGIHDREQGAIYLNPEEVRRLNSQRPNQDQPAHA